MRYTGNTGVGWTAFNYVILGPAFNSTHVLFRCLSNGKVYNMDSIARGSDIVQKESTPIQLQPLCISPETP